MAHDAELIFAFADADSAARVAGALDPEVGDIEGDRTRARISRDGATLTLRIEARDLIGLRAGLNTWCSLVEVAERAGGVAVSRRRDE